MIKAILVDDEARSRKTVEMLLHQHFPDIEVVGQGENVKTGLELINKLEPQLVFLDIEMPDGSGFDLLRKLDDYNFELIFTTAFDEYALEAFRVSAIGYLQKPISTKEFQETVSKAIELIKLRHGSREGQINALLENYNNPSGKINKLILPDTEGFHVIPIADIVYLEGDRNYSKIFLTSRESLTSSYNLGWYEKFLDKGFFRISRSHIINIAHVTRFSKGDGGIVTMVNDAELPVTAGRKEELRKMFL